MNYAVRESFPARLKALRIESGRSQADLARELGITRSCLANYEAGKRQPDNDMLIRIADLFQVLTDYLFSRTDARQLGLSAVEIEDSMRLKLIVQKIGDKLDLSKIDLESRYKIIEYYDYILSKTRLRSSSASKQQEEAI